MNLCDMSITLEILFFCGCRSEDPADLLTLCLNETEIINRRIMKHSYVALSCFPSRRFSHADGENTAEIQTFTYRRHTIHLLCPARLLDQNIEFQALVYQRK